MKSGVKKLSSKVQDLSVDKTNLNDSLFKNIITVDDSGNKKQVGILMKNSAIDSNHKTHLKNLFLGDYGPNPENNKKNVAGMSWEYAIVIKNPDFLGQENSAITLEMGDKLYRKFFRPKKTGSLHQDRLTFLNESRAFTEAFKTLNDLEGGKSQRYGGKIEIIDGKVKDHGGVAKDFSSLIRNAIFYKLVGSLGLKSKQMVSASGEFIYIVVTADENDLELEAERTRFSKQLEIALTDIQSLLPCDLLDRPMHLLKNNDEEIKKILRAIKPFLRKALGLEKNSEGVDYKYEPCGVTPTMWNVYKVYLSLLKDGIEKIESSIGSHKNQMFLFQKLIKDSLEKANLGISSKDQLKNLWGRFEIPKPVAPYAEYRRSSKDDELHDLWRSHEIDQSGKRCLFRSMERIRLLNSYMETEISLNALQALGYIEAHFPLHNFWQLKGHESNLENTASSEDKLLKNILYDFKPLNTDGPLVTCWNTSLINQKIPLSKIRNYFGEKIGLYFEFLRFYQVSLLVPALIGLGVFIVQRMIKEDDPIVLIINAAYSVFMTIWATVFLESWMRHESSLSIVWGQTKFEKVEIARPQYKGVERRSPITDEMDEIHYDDSKRYKFLLLALTVSLTIILLVLGLVAAIIILKSFLTNTLLIGGIDFAGPVCSILNAIQILIFNFIYSKLAKSLTDLENHKTENQYQDSFILKVFAFQFVNSFNSLIYIAFAKSYYEGCIVTNDNGEKEKIIGASCMNELYVQLISIFIVSYVKNLVELGVPFIKFQMRKRRKAKAKLMNNTQQAEKDIRSWIEAQLYLEYYLTSDKDGTIEDFMEIAVQFGYLTLFAIAFPLSATLTFVGLWLEMFTDKLKVLKLVRRPLPLATKDIGTWWSIFSVICVFAIFSNTALFCFTSRTFQDWDAVKDYNYVIFALVVVILLIFRSQLQSWIPDVPEKFSILQGRHEFIVERVLRGNDKPVIVPDNETFDGNLYYTE